MNGSTNATKVVAEMRELKKKLRPTTKNLRRRTMNNPMTEEPPHHRRYRVAWDAFRDPDTPDECKGELMTEMDSAQNHFEWDEFHEFKLSLEGFEAYWAAFLAMGKKIVGQMKNQKK